jgi:hypothetical protein
MLWHTWSVISGGRIKLLYIDPVFHFTWYGFEWVRPWPGAGMYIHFIVMLGLSVFVTLGFYYRIAAPLLCGCFTYVFLLEQTTYQNHVYLLVLVGFLMTLLPAHRTFSLDVIRIPTMRLSVVPAWVLWILRFQMGIPYFLGGVAKFNADWLHGAPMRLLLADKGSFPLIGPWIDQNWMVDLFAWGALTFDLLIVPLLLWQLTQKPAFIFSVMFHLVNAALFRIGVFPWLMIGLTTVFFQPGWPRQLWRMQRHAVATPTSRRMAGQSSSLNQQLVMIGLSAYMCVQLLVPFRHSIYSGNVDWTEEGARFSWRMMLRGKTVRLDFHATHTPSGKTERVNPGPYLARYQALRMQDPDMVLQFSRYLSQQLKLSSEDQVEIRATMLASLNGRRPQPLIDPQVNLAARHRSLWHKPWIVPLTQSLRPEPWSVPVHQWDELLSGRQDTRQPQQ